MFKLDGLLKVDGHVSNFVTTVYFKNLKFSLLPTAHFGTKKIISSNKPSAHRIVSRIIRKESDHSEAFSLLKRLKKETSRPGNGARINETKKL